MTDLHTAISPLTDRLNCLEKRNDSIPQYEGLSDSLLWPDETPLVPLDHDSELPIFRCLLRYRTSVIVGEPLILLKPYWELAIQLFPGWPGFSPERCQHSHALKSLFERQKQIFNDEMSIASDELD